MDKSVSVNREINASAETLWSMVSDVTRMGEWSPETTGCTWAGDSNEPVLNARFKGTNARGKRTWSTSCTVIECEPSKSFAFHVSVFGISVADWSYRFEPTETGSSVTETFTDRRGWLPLKLGGPISGVADRGEHNRAGMAATLDALATVAETAAT